MESATDLAVVSRLRFEHGDVVLGVGVPSPRLSWQIQTEDRDWSQTSYELELNGDEVVRVASAEQVLVPWPFAPLRSRQRASVRVRVASGQVWSQWSEPSTIELGLLEPTDWSARFISPRTTGGMSEPAPILSRTFSLGSGIRSARLYVTAHGGYEASINGQRVGDEVLAPGWTSYPNRLTYQTYDVTGLLHDGENQLEALLGNGWYRGGPARQFAPEGRSALYGDRLALLAQLEVTYEDTTVQVVGSDEPWTARDSCVLENDLFNGQRTDLRRHSGGNADAVDVLDEDLSRLVTPTGPPVRVTEVIPAVKVWTAPSGAILVDFGQNVVGWVRLRVRDAAAGAEVIVRHAEVLVDEELYVRTLWNAKATDSYVLDGASEVVLEPSLTFHGFRYAEIVGVTTVNVDDVEAAVVGTDLRRTGWFSCSDPDVNRLHENVVWSARGNFLSIPTDCPQRSERVGWTADIQAFAPSACFLFDVTGFLSSWLDDLAAEQCEDGAVPQIVPNIAPDVKPAAGWGDAAVVVPWALYRSVGDIQVLERQFPSMCAWLDKVVSLTSEGLWQGGFQWGDWLDPDIPQGKPFAAKADADVVATAYLARSADIVAQAARILNQNSSAEKYAALAQRTQEAFADAYVTGTGRVTSEAPTVYALAIEFALLPTERQRQRASNRFADLVRLSGFRISTGFLGTPFISDALCTAGYSSLAYRLLLERGCPSWLYPITMGATTVWEYWNALFPDGTVNPRGWVSFNHYAFGAVADWLHRSVAGLALGAPGYREISIRPIPDSALTHASTRHLTPYGAAAVSWQRSNGVFHLDVTIPVGAHATVHLPGESVVEVGHGQYSWSVPDPCSGDNKSVSTVRDLIDDPHLWHQVVSAYTDSGLVKDSAEVARLFARKLDEPALDALPANSGHECLDAARKALIT